MKCHCEEGAFCPTKAIFSYVSEDCFAPAGLAMTGNAALEMTGFTALAMTGLAVLEMKGFAPLAMTKEYGWSRGITTYTS